MNEPSDTDRIINRHTARLLTELEEANCPIIYVHAVKSKLAWMRSDLNELKGTNDGKRHNP
jgi:hypothetical protein